MMGNYRYLTLRKQTSAEELEGILREINDEWFFRCLEIEVNDDEEDDTIFWLHDDNGLINLSFQVWLNKSNTKKITYHPNVQPIVIGVIEEFIAMKLREKLGGKITYEM